MAIDRISNAGAINVSSTAKPARQPERGIQVADIGAGTGSVKTETVATVTSGSNKNGNTQTDRRNQDRAGVQSDREISPDKVKSAVDDLNKQIKMRHTQCSFKYHEETNRISITVTDSETQEVIKEIPPEKALDMLAKAWELAGLMVDEKR